MGDVFRKAWLSYRNTGPARTLQRAVQRTFPSWLFDFNSLIAIESNFEDVNLLPVNDEWHYRWAAKNDLELLMQGGLSEQDIQYFWDHDGRAAVCEQAGKLVGYTWYMAKNPVVFGWIRVRLDREVYSAAGYVAPEFRGRQIQSQARRFAFAALRDLGYVTSYSFIEHFNRSSWRGGSHSVRRYIGRVSYVRLLGLVIYTIDGKWGAGFWSHARPFELSFDDFIPETFDLHHDNSETRRDSE